MNVNDEYIDRYHKVGEVLLTKSICFIYICVTYEISTALKHK